MATVYSRKAPKQPTNLSINSDLLNAARESGVNLSAALEEALAEKVAVARREKWIRENAEAIEGQAFVLLVPQLAGIAANELGAAVTTIAQHRNDVVAALDFLITGI